MKKPLIAAGVTAAVGIASVTGIGIASADTNNSASKNPMSSLVDAIATKFDLKEADVQAVFDEQHAQMQEQRAADAKAELAQLVTDGKLTQTQADAITAKRTELESERKTNRDSAQTTSDEDRKASMENMKTELDTWLSDNDIPTEYRYLLFGGGRGHGGQSMRDGSSTADQQTDMDKPRSANSSSSTDNSSSES